MRLSRKWQQPMKGTAGSGWTITIETSELLSKMLTRRGIPHKVLNAKFHEAGG